jgi:glyoxylase-like metal-dependent hydrolase (beta-lactamase superfamily II)
MRSLTKALAGSMRARVAGALAVAAACAVAFQAQTTGQAAYRFQQIAPGIYSAIGTGALNAGSNSAVIVNRDDVVIVDSHISPESAAAMLRELPSITDKPVRFLVNTHFHYDHTNGNQVFGPAVDIIGHEYTRARLADPDYTHKGMLGALLTGMPRQVQDLGARAAAAPDAAARARLEQQAHVQSAFAASLQELNVTPPNVTIVDRLTLFRGDREIRLLYLGRGHTGGDVVVYLPKERVLCSGDLLVNGIANLVDGYVNEWPATLDKLAALDFEDDIPGHGEPFKGKERIGWFQDYLKDLWRQASALHAQHVASDEAAKRIDLTAHKAHFATITGPGVPAVAVARIYAVIEGRAD